MSSSVMRTLAYEKVRLAVYDKYGALLGYFVPDSYTQDTQTLMLQCLEYSDDKKRIAMARSMEVAAIHNLRANIRYYGKQHSELEAVECELTTGIKQMNEAKSVNELLLIEARCRQKYYQAFNTILDDLTFYYEKRSRRPPLDEINALISFGNTLLYNRIQQMIWRTSLDSRIGIFHSATRRHYSLNLDFADLFKPLIVDRIIFTLVNRKQLTRSDFERLDDGSVLLTNRGKRLFIESFEEKLHSRLMVKDVKMTYAQLIEGEIRIYQNHIKTGEVYKPYKYY